MLLGMQPLTRRQTLVTLSTLGIGTAAFQRALAWQAEQSGKVTPELIQQAEWVSGITLSDEDRKAITQSVERDQRRFEALRKVELDHSTPPALSFYVAPPQESIADVRRDLVRPTVSAAPTKPNSDEDVAFLSVTQLAALIRTRQISSVELTKLYIGRLRKYDPVLKCVVTFTEDLALAQAKKADNEIAAGRYRGPLHGIPWGAKDIIAWPGYPTTW